MTLWVLVIVWTEESWCAAVECMKMFDCREMSDVIARRKSRFLQRYAQSDSTVCLVCNEHILVKDLSVSRHV